MQCHGVSATCMLTPSKYVAAGFTDLDTPKDHQIGPSLADYVSDPPASTLQGLQVAGVYIHLQYILFLCLHLRLFWLLCEQLICQLATF